MLLRLVVPGAARWRIIDIALVLRQLREERLTARTLLLLAAIMAWAGYT